VWNYSSCTGIDTRADDCLACETCVNVSGTVAECRPTTAHVSQQCGVDGDIHWVDSCGAQGADVFNCSACGTCENTSATTATCTADTVQSYTQCDDFGDVQWFDTCDRPGEIADTCIPASEVCENSSTSAASCQPQSCDDISTQCYGYGGNPGCWGCAMTNECASFVAACAASAPCSNLEACLVPCNQMSGIEWQTCTDACKAANAGGVALLASYHACIYCDACPINCAADAAGKCL